MEAISVRHIPELSSYTPSAYSIVERKERAHTDAGSSTDKMKISKLKIEWQNCQGGGDKTERRYSDFIIYRWKATIRSSNVS